MLLETAEPLMSDSQKPNQPGTQPRIVFMSGLTVMIIAIYQTVNDGAPDKYTAGALLALALGGGVGRVADGLIKGYVQTQIREATESAKESVQTPPVPPVAEPPKQISSESTDAPPPPNHA